MTTKKTLVIGHEGLSGVDCMAWHGSEVNNIVDYELCIVDQSSVTLTDLANIKPERVNKIKSLLSRLIVSRGQLVVIYDQNLKTKLGDSFEWSPVSFSFHTESGDTISVSDSPFSEYLAQFRKWNRFLIEAEPERTLRTLLGIQTSKIKVVVAQLMTNREQRSLAFHLNFEVFNRKHAANTG